MTIEHGIEFLEINSVKEFGEKIKKKTFEKFEIDYNQNDPDNASKIITDSRIITSRSTVFF